eukprot:1216022-Pyramimonas_sp.AAC.1
MATPLRSRTGFPQGSWGPTRFPSAGAPDTLCACPEGGAPGAVGACGTHGARGSRRASGAPGVPGSLGPQ